MKSKIRCKIFVLWMICISISSFLWAEVTVEQWQADAFVFQDLLNREPKDYAAAVNVARKWVQYAEADEDSVLAVAGEGFTKETLTGILNNVYREAASVMCTDYTAIVERDGIKAAEYAIDIQQFFRGNPEIFEEFAAANNSNSGAMQQVFEQAIKDAIIKTYDACAAEYSSLRAQGKLDEAKTLSMQWMRVVSEWNATNSPIPDAFMDFTHVNTSLTVQDIKFFENDIEEWKRAVSEGNEAMAFQLVEKWLQFRDNEVFRAITLEYIFTGETEVDWRNSLYVATYMQLWVHDVRKYEQALLEGKTRDAGALIEKWIGIFNGEFGAAICDGLGFEVGVAEAVRQMREQKARLEVLSPTQRSPHFNPRQVNEFFRDLERFNRCQMEAGFIQADTTSVSPTSPGSESWREAMSEAMELANKWSNLTKNNAKLARAIKAASGIDLPKDADNSVTQLTHAMVNRTAPEFNNAIGSGELTGVRDILEEWRGVITGSNGIISNTNEAISGTVNTLTVVMENLTQAAENFNNLINISGSSSNNEINEEEDILQPAGLRSFGVTGY
jgi:hypothetical protein